MRLLLCILCLVRVIQAAPTTNTSDSPESLWSSESSTCANQRTLWDIISTCALTLLACIYSSIHLNIPSPEDSSIRIFLRRVGTMGIALLAPDLLVGWAMRQWLWARQITAQVKESHLSVCYHPQERSEDHAGTVTQALVAHTKVCEGNHTLAESSKEWFKVYRVSEQSENYEWTETHSFFALMGGFMLYVDGEPYHILLPHQLLRLIRAGSIDFPTLTVKEIRDRSKGNMISKGLVTLQVSWFIMQLISRAIYHLETTQIEAATLAFAVLNFITYAVWWNKPIDIQCSHPVYWKSSEPKPADDYFDDVSENDDLGAVHSERVVPSLINSILLVIGVDAMSPRKLRVPTYDDMHNINLKRWEGNLLTLTGITVSTLFGGIHCTAWFYVFPTYEEEVTWRVCAVTIIVAPLLAFVVAFLFKFIPTAGKIDEVVRFMFTMACPILYIISRSILFVLMFTTLRNLPPDAYKIVAWTSFVPHL
ncbi:uncharacterized protein EDB91DRAFT_619985 [Suillus paluster]|uniref:uncharacterized protein n=1 Tax=Suillus paluster TaxID=48578 RepID=UPI001B86B7EE|nr:uncharacterized protein EDB91DRAFT_619985 [Suillus paluster]KAG1734052.1 hypothetical protein EDB91DRAFT_619985 [Suillus paluster]